MDITTQAVANTATIHVKNASNELLYADVERTKPVQIIVHGPGSKAYGVVESRQTARSIKRMQENDNKITAAPFEERVKETAEDLAAITIEFVNLEYPPAGDKKGADLFEALYADQRLGFIAKQVTKFVSDWSNFKVSSAGS